MYVLNCLIKQAVSSDGLNCRIKWQSKMGHTTRSEVSTESHCQNHE